MSTVVGALAVELGLDTAQFERSLKSLPGMTQTHFNSMSAEMKRTSKEGAESLRLIDEAFGIHISRPIARIISQEFPGFAKSMQSLLGLGVGLGIFAAGFDFIAKAVDRVTKSIEEAKRKQEEWIDSSHKLQTMLLEGTNSFNQQMDQIREKLADLSGDKAGALGARLRIITRDDAAEAVKAIDDITEAFVRNAKAAEEANSAWNKFKLGTGKLFTSSFDLQTEEIRKSTEEIKRQFDDLVLSDPLHGLAKGESFLTEEIKKAKTEQAELLKNQVSGVDALLSQITFLDTFLGKHAIATKEMVTEGQSRIDALEASLKRIQQLEQVDAGKKTVAAKESAAQHDIGEKEIEKLKAETAAQLALAAATAKGSAELKLQQAAGEADQIVSRILTEAHGRLTKQIQEELATVHALTAERLVAKDAVALNQELLKETEGYDRQIDAIKSLASAYAAGGSAIAGALIEKQLEADKQKIADYTKEFEALQAKAEQANAQRASLAGAPGPVQGIVGVDPKALDTLKAKIDEANASLEKHREQLEAIRSANYTLEINKESDALKVEQPYLDQLNEAYTQNAEAVRKAQVALALFHWEQAHPGATADQIAAVSAQLEQQSINQQRAADAQLASRYSVLKTYDDEMDRLERARELIQQTGGDTLEIDAAIYDQRQKMIKQWDDAALRVGTFQEKFQAAMNEIQLKGEEASQRMAQSWMTAIDGINGSLAKLLTGQKTDFRKVIQQLAEEQTKGQLEKAEASIAGRFNLNLPGLGGNRPDGTSSNPLHVSIVSDSTTRSRTSSPAAAATASLSSVPGAIQEKPSTPADFFSSLLFGGFLADGGNTRSGTSYIVGERGPELFTATSNGTIVPNHQLGNSNFTFNPKGTSPEYQAYNAYLRSLHPSGGDSTWFQLLALAEPFLLKGFGNLFRPKPTPASTATSVGASVPGSLPGGGVGFGIGSGVTSDAPPPAAALASLVPNFAGMMAEGGDVFAGNSYMVGERGPELLRIPQKTEDLRAGGAGPVDNSRTTHITQNFSGVKDGDQFRRTVRQENSRMFRHLR